MATQHLPAGAGDARARILVICTANVARSPLVEVLLAAHVGHRGLDGQMLVDSAGVQARTGQPAAQESQRLAAQVGYDLSHHRSRHVDDVAAETSELVLTMSGRQRDHLGLRVAGLGPRVFTLPEAARLAQPVLESGTGQLGSAGVHRLRDAVRLLHLERPRRVAGPQGDNVDDPFGRGEQAYLTMANTVAAAVATVADLLFGPARGR